MRLLKKAAAAICCGIALGLSVMPMPSSIAESAQEGTALNLKRSYLILNLTDMNDLPAMDRWLFKEHSIDTVSGIGSILFGYATYRALPIPRGGNIYGAYNWRMTELIGNPENSEKRADRSPQADPNAHSPAFVFTNRRIDDEIKGGGNTTVNDEPFFRFLIAMKYPEGVSQEDGEKWFSRT